MSAPRSRNIIGKEGAGLYFSVNKVCNRVPGLTWKKIFAVPTRFAMN